jgi:hypothetical protein
MQIHDPNFVTYLSEKYPLHAAKIFKAQSNAWLARIGYPVLFFILPAMFFAGIAFFVFAIKDPSYSSLQPETRMTSFFQSITLRNALFSVISTGVFLSSCSFIIGLFIGVARAHSLLFEAEKLKIYCKNLWILEKTYDESNQKPEQDEPTV